MDNFAFVFGRIYVFPQVPQIKTLHSILIVFIFSIFTVPRNDLSVHNQLYRPRTTI
jgi:hypothetical protein